jgi:glycosyltransferase involved in cell wall biosynthesis
VVLSVGALTPNKGFDFIIQGLGQVAANLRPKLVIVSNYQEPAERVYLEQLAQRHQVQLMLRTLVPNEELVRLYNVAKMVVYAPILEPFGLVPLEAMACGTPVVAVREGGVHESVMDERTGLLVERNAQAFALAVERLLQDHELAVRLGRQARDYTLAEWTWDQSIQKLEAQLHSVVKGSPVEVSHQLHLVETK